MVEALWLSKLRYTPSHTERLRSQWLTVANARGFHDSDDSHDFIYKCSSAKHRQTMRENNVKFSVCFFGRFGFFRTLAMADCL